MYTYLFFKIIFIMQSPIIQILKNFTRSSEITIQMTVEITPTRLLRISYLRLTRIV